MVRIALVTGGSRSGKSAFAQRVAEGFPAPRTYVATAPVTDAEMEERIRKHRAARETSGWKTIEETLDLAGSLRAAAGSGIILVDCLTLWIGNLLYEAERAGDVLTEEAVAGKCREALRACAERSSPVIFVTNEVGMGIVPDNALARRFRDLAGRCNQVMAQAADSVVLVVSGQPLQLKGEKIF